MASKTFNSRIILKHDIEENWNKATNFIPLLGEVIIYDPDENYEYSRLKIGDGVATVINLPFELDPIISNMVGKKTTGNVYTINGTGVTAAEGAEIFNNYDDNIATGKYSHAEGAYTIAAGKAQHAEGMANIEDNNDQYIHISGNGVDSDNRSNAYHLDWNGNGWFAGDIYVGSTSGKDQDEGSKKLATEDYVETLYKKLNSNTVLGFYCIEDVTIVTNGISKTYPANSNVEVAFIEGDVFEIIPTSDNSILSLTAFPSALGTFYSWLEGVAQFSNILFDMNAEDMYTKWSQGQQGEYNVQRAQYSNCIFWSDNPYISDVSKRTNYTLTHTSQLPLCYSTIPDNTFKAFYLAGGVISDPNWVNQAYLDSFAKATWATQAFSYYGARTVGLPELFNIALPKDCRGLMFYAKNVENAGTFDAINTTNFGAKSGSWREAFGSCTSLRRLYITNLKVNLNISWSPINYESIYFIISKAANTNAITISVSPYTYNLLGPSDFELATSKNITIALLAGNYVEDRRLSDITNKADKTELENYYNKTEVDDLLNSKPNIENPEFSGSLGLNHAGELGFTSVSLGFANTASGMYCFAEGMGNKATGDASHAEGTGNTASGYAAHAEGSGTLAQNVGSHAEGANTKSLGYGSHAEGSNTIASGEGQHVEGKYNIEDTTSAHIVGNGTSNSERSNAHTIDWDGNAWFAGAIKIGGTGYNDETAVNVVLDNDVITIDEIDAICGAII